MSSETGAKLASYVEGHREDLIASVIRSSALPRPGSIAATVFANEFLDHFVAELRSGDREALDHWAETETEPADVFEHARIVVITCAILSTRFRADQGESDEVMSFLAVRSNELENRLRQERIPAGSTRTDMRTMASRDDVVNSLLSALEARDHATCDHSRSVGQWSGRLAKAMGLSDEQQEIAGLAGTLHDIGKIGTPSEILLKKGPLTEDEWVTMRNHSRIGAKMLEKIASLRDIAPYVRSHHERIDGNGYPDRLAGEAIPLVSRIVAVADAFHAMTSRRPYRVAMPITRAIEELREGAGLQFDATVVEALVKVIAPEKALPAATPAAAVAGGTGDVEAPTQVATPENSVPPKP